MMKSAIAVLCALLAFSSLGACQDIQQLLADVPSCATPCVFEQLEQGNCSIIAFSTIPDCACTNITLLSGLSFCVQQSCTFSDQMDAAVVLSDLCAEYPKESRQHEVVAAGISCIALTLIFTVLRCISRYMVSSGLWWDDWLIIVATVSLIALCSIQIAATPLALGMHYWDISPIHARPAFKLFYSAQVMYIVVQVTSKVAILVLFWRIFVEKRFRIIVWCCVLFLVTHGIVFLFLVIFQCRPIRSVWDKTVPASCLGIQAIGAVGAALAIIEDVVILLLPIRQVFKLQLTFKKKLGVCLIFSVGSFACITSMIRLRYVITYKYIGDYTWHNVDFFIWCMIELACAVICGCLPTLRPLMKKFFGIVSSVRDHLYPRSTTTDPSWFGGSHGQFSKLSDPTPLPTPVSKSTPLQTLSSASPAMTSSKELPPLPTPVSLKESTSPRPSIPLEKQTTPEPPTTPGTPTALQGPTPLRTSLPVGPEPQPWFVPLARSLSLARPTSLERSRSMSLETTVPLERPTTPKSTTPLQSPTKSTYLPKRGSQPIDWFAALPSPLEDSKPFEMNFLDLDFSRPWYASREEGQRQNARKSRQGRDLV